MFSSVSLQALCSALQFPHCSSSTYPVGLPQNAVEAGKASLILHYPILHMKKLETQLIRHTQGHSLGEWQNRDSRSGVRLWEKSGGSPEGNWDLLFIAREGLSI